MPSMLDAVFRRVHLYAFRIIIACSIFMLWSIAPALFLWNELITSDRILVALCCEVFLHHASSLFALTALPNLLDLVLVLAEVSVWLVPVAKDPKQYKFDPWASESYSIFITALYMQIATLFVLGSCRLFRLINARRQGIFAKMNFDQQMPQSWHSVLFGVSLFKERYQNEPRFLRIFRALIANTLICGLIVYSLFVLVLGPVQETGLPPVKIFRGPNLLYTQLEKLPFFNEWGILVLLHSHTVKVSNITTADIKSSINIAVLAAEGIDPKSACTLGPQKFKSHQPDGRARSGPVESVKFSCQKQSDTSPGGILTEDDYEYSNLIPELLITINFTSLNITPKSLGQARQQGISILVGLTKDDSDVISNTIPTPLFPGSHLHASVLRQVRKIYTPRSLASLGTFAFSRTFMTAQLTFITPDPSPFINRQEDTATLRIYTQNDLSDWTIVEDYREHYVLDGLSSVGGFWAFINGVFAFFFGSTLAMIIFGSRRLNTFGVLDQVGKKEIRKNFEYKYPKLGKEVPREERGLLEFLREHFVSLDHILDQKGPAASSDPAATGPEMTQRVANASA